MVSPAAPGMLEYAQIHARWVKNACVEKLLDLNGAGNSHPFVSQRNILNVG